MRIHVPFRSDGGQRDRLWRACRARWLNLIPEAVIVASDQPGEPFNRSAARNRTAEGRKQVDAAVAHATRTGCLTFAHTWRAGLGQAATEDVLAGADPASVERQEWDRNTFSGCYAVPRSLWNAVGGFDERFLGWGGEDLAFMKACGALGGVDRVPGTIHHLWHPRSRAEQEEQPHYAANWALYERYLTAGRNPAAMREVLSR